MTCDKKISVIIPTYNIAPYIGRCLDSIIEQTYTNLEIIVIDDGSTDNTRDVIDEYKEKDSRIVTIYKENTGVSDTRNKGLEIASGDYIGFVDGDDYIDSKMFELLMNNMAKYGADISHCGYRLKFPQSEFFLYGTDRIVEQDNQQGVIDLLEGQFIEPSLGNKLFSKKCVDGLRMRKDLKINEDLLFDVMAFAKADKSIFEDKALYNYMMRSYSATTSKGLSYNKVFDMLKVREIITEMFEEGSRVYPVAVATELRTAVHTYRILTTNKLPEEFKREKKNIRKKVKKLYAKAKSLGVTNKRTTIDSMLIMYCPVAFTLLYILYGKTIKNRSKIYRSGSEVIKWVIL